MLQPEEHIETSVGGLVREHIAKYGISICEHSDIRTRKHAMGQGAEVRVDPHYPGSNVYYLSREAPKPRREWEPATTNSIPSWYDDDDRWAAIGAARSTWEPRRVSRQRVGMPRGAHPMPRREGRLSLLALIRSWLFPGKR
jgi:hypothetical protein